MRITDLLNFLLLSKPIIQSQSPITVFTCVPIIVTQVPECFGSFHKLKIVLSAGGVDGKHLIELVHTGV